MNKKTITIIFISITVLVFAVAGVYFISLKGGKPSGEFSIGLDVSGIGKGTENVLKNMPIVNPLEKLANPFRDAYKNPFE